MSTDTSDKPGTSTRVRSGGGVRRERQEERGEEENVENEGADSLRDHGSGSQGVTGDQVVQRELILQRELTIQRDLNLQRELTIQMNIVRACAVILTLMFAIFTVRTVDRAMDCNPANSELLSNLTLERNQFQTRYDNVTLQRNQLQTIHDKLTLKIQQLERELHQFKRGTAVKCSSGWQTFGCSCYYRSTEKTTWEKSRELCLNTGGRLVVINSEEEQEFIRELNHGGEESWIGLQKTKDDKWTWVNGAPLLTGNWASGQPVDYVAWNCAVYQHSEGKWANKFCSDTLHTTKWICEK